MIPVLMRSKRKCSSAWVMIRSRTHLRIAGMSSGDLLDARFEGVVGKTAYYEDGDKPIPEGAVRVQIIHVSASGNPVDVDLING